MQRNKGFYTVKRMTDDIDWKRRYEDECAIVDKCWKATGITTYGGARGMAIWEIIELYRKALAKIGNDDITAREQFDVCSDYSLWRACQGLARDVLSLNWRAGR